MTLRYYPTNVVEHEDGSHSIVIGEGDDTITFGPYGPGECDEVHPGSGTKCCHGRNHVGCCASPDGDDKLPRYRWNPTNRKG